MLGGISLCQKRPKEDGDNTNGEETSGVDNAAISAQTSSGGRRRTGRAGNDLRAGRIGEGRKRRGEPA